MNWKTHIIIVKTLVFLSGYCYSQSSDSTNTASKKITFFIGVDSYSALAPVSVLAGIRNKFGDASLSATYMYSSLRVALYYDYFISRKHRFSMGFGFHNSFVPENYNMNKSEYAIFAKEEAKKFDNPCIAFFPLKTEVRHQLFFSIALKKDFKIYKNFHMAVKAMGVYGINSFFKCSEFLPFGGIQCYFTF